MPGLMPGVVGDSRKASLFGVLVQSAIRDGTRQFVQVDEYRHGSVWPILFVGDVVVVRNLDRKKER